jgi:hypothetical protein
VRFLRSAAVELPLCISHSSVVTAQLSLITEHTDAIVTNYTTRDV